MNDSQNKKQQVLIMGGGIGGLCAALTLAELNIPVLLVEKSSAVGGILNQLDQQFPNDHCGICRMLPMVNREDGFQFCARRGIFQEKITVMTRTIVTSVSGTPGRFTAVLEETLPGVDAEKCTLCGACMECCPVEVPDDFNAGLSCRKAVYQPVPFGINPSPVIDWGHCTQCGACV
ncbi:MAG: FAD-binding protein, partial [Proteobacteria bacterium]|nr:FAD-binding protein [Pseudomonadota bacterium]